MHEACCRDQSLGGLHVKVILIPGGHEVKTWVTLQSLATLATDLGL